jgi:DNA-binding FadR family transcriptional regulator
MPDITSLSRRSLGATSIDLDPAETLNRLNRSALRDQIEIQCVLEAEAARLAARRRVSADMARLHKCLMARGEYSPEGDLAQFLDRDRSFHFAIAMASHNEALQAIYSSSYASIYTLTKTIFSDTELPEPSLKDHAAIVEAIAAGDEELAAEAARTLLKPLLEKLDELLGSRNENAHWMSKIGATYWK